ncbi:hypothetical protein J4407_03580 [Candidatus Pacearchaeota archaeon]|nr:hypothetical protein [Candidatus Pacearchaeota archaeon]
MGETLYMALEYDVRDGSYKIDGNLNEEGQCEILENFLRSRMNEGIDNSEPEVKNIYSIRIEWNPEDDSLRCAHDTGNKSLRDAILLNVFKKMLNLESKVS